MLLGLTIRDVVLVDRLDLTFRPGLCVLTGETGAGKSILLDALGLALGGRAGSGLVRDGAAQAMVTAEFEPAEDHPVWQLLEEQGIARGEGGILVLRRVLTADGRSRAFVDDQPVGVGLLKRLGETLVEIQGQFEQQGLLDPATHRGLLDAYGGHESALAALVTSWRDWRRLAEERAAAEERLARARGEEEYLRHALAELETLAPEPGEEAALAERRLLLAHREKLAEALSGAAAELAGERGAERALNLALRQLERVRDRAGARLDAVLAALERALAETREASSELDAATRELDLDPRALETIAERLFALRGLARKHGVAVDDLAALRDDLAGRVAALEDGGGAVARLAAAEAEARQAYRERAERLSALRRKAAKALDKAVARELPPLKLEKASFRTVLAPLAEAEWGEAGMDRVHFEVATNPGAPPGPLAKIASGGELSRFMLALKVVLAKTSPVPTLVFDEVDSGIGGAVAAAVGDRLQRLAEEIQVLVVTHSPQVAAKGAAHWRVAKKQSNGRTRTEVEPLDEVARREEIARMLSGSIVTPEARAAAESLMTGG